MDDLHRVSKALLEFETRSGDEVQTILDGGHIDRSDESRPGPTGRRSSVPSSGKAAKDAGKGKDAGEAPGGLEPEPQPGGGCRPTADTIQPVRLGPRPARRPFFFVWSDPAMRR